MKLNFWLIFGLFAQGCFFMRFFIQWLASEKQKKSVVPVYFWYFSLAGGISLLIYAIHIKDFVFTLGQGAGVFIYLRNLILINRNKKSPSNASKPGIKYMGFGEILEIIAEAAKKSEILEIYYPNTENSAEGWREVEPYSLTTDTGPEGEHLIFGQDRLSPGHIFNAFTVGSKDNHCDSFIIGKIRAARPTGRKFKPRHNWKVEF